MASTECNDGHIQSASSTPEPSIVCQSEPPYKVVYVNRAWESLCGYSAAEMTGRDLRLLQGPATQRVAIERLMESVRKCEACVVPSLVNYDKQRRPFSHDIVVTPLNSPDGSVNLFRATSRSVSLLNRACRGATSSVDLRGEAGLDALAGRGAVDTTASTLAAIASQKRAREPSGADLLSPSMLGLDQQPPPPLYPSLSLPCVAPSMVVLTAATPPYAVLWASPGWLDVCGFSLPEILGTNLGCIQGPATDRTAIKKLMSAVKSNSCCTLHGLINYDKRRRPFRHTLTVKPIAANGAPIADHGDEAVAESAASSDCALVAPSHGTAHGTAHGTEVSMFRAESSDVSLSCGGLFECGGGSTSSPMQEEIVEFWGEGLEDFHHSFCRVADALEPRSGRSQR